MGPKPTRALAKPVRGALVRPDVAADLGRARELADASDASNTLRAYADDERDWQKYADAINLRPSFLIAPEVLISYIGSLDRRGLKVSTIRRRCAAIAWMHRQKGKDSPTEDPRVRKVLKGLVRERRVAPKRKKALTGSILRKALLSEGLSADEQALLTTGFVTGLRRSELVSLFWEDVEKSDGGVVLNIRSSKTDQRGEGAYVAIPYSGDKTVCPARILLHWKEISKDIRVFPFSDKKVARIVKKAVKLAGEDPSEYSGHSLRAGLATTAAKAGVTLAESMSATRHKSANVAASYVRVETALENRAHQAAVDALKGKS